MPQFVITYETRIKKNMISSEIHLVPSRTNLSLVPVDSECLTTSRYSFRLPGDMISTTPSLSLSKLKSTSQRDNQSPPRKQRHSSHIIYLTVNHMRSSVLEDVGTQLWRGAFLMCDILLSKRTSRSEFTIVELGCGAGLAAIISSILPCRAFYATDCSQKALDLALLNIEANNHLPSALSRCSSPVFVRKLDWTVPINPRIDILDGWSIEDKHFLSHECLFIAADVIYDDELTIAFFHMIKTLIRRGETLLLTLEKRMNFSIDHLALVPNGYDIFISQLNNCCTSDKQLVGRRIPLNEFPPHYFSQSYDRGNDLELWEIQLLQA